MRTCLRRGKAGRRQAARISARSHVISDRKFSAAHFFSKFSVRIASKNARNPARRGILMLVKHFADVSASRQGRALSGDADFGAIARDLGSEKSKGAGGVA